MRADRHLRPNSIVRSLDLDCSRIAQKRRFPPALECQSLCRFPTRMHVASEIRYCYWGSSLEETIQQPDRRADYYNRMQRMNRDLLAYPSLASHHSAK